MGEKLRVWWIPQVGAIKEPFFVPVKSPEEGKKVLDILAVYDAYQLQNNIKGDYCNTGGLEVYNPETADYEDWYVETEDYYCDDLDEYMEIKHAEEIDEINDCANELRKQVDWDKIR